VLFVLIPLAWLAIVTLFVALCMAASRSDAHPTLVIEASDRALPSGVVLWEEARRERPLRRPQLRAGRRVRSRRLAHGVR
jgi:hypothetical protein